jgi:uncharacterized tellurite resistance protein B-like protein
MQSILSFLGLAARPEVTESETIRRIAGELDRLEPDLARYIAAFAFVLSRLAAADHEVTADEARTMERLVREKGGLPGEQAALVVALARTQQRLFGATDDFLVTRELQRVASYDQRLHLVDCLFAVAAVDEHIRLEEIDEIARIARELRIEQADLSDLRSRYRDFLSIRHGLDGSSG